MRSWLQLFALTVLIILVSSAQAQNVRVRGTIEKIERNSLMVKSRDRADLKLMLKDNVRITAVVRASLSDLNPD